jgi:aspartate aminotransferase
MPIAKAIAQQLENSSWVRRMFEEGARLRKERGADAVFDFSLGNPDVEPPQVVIDALKRVAAANRAGSHGYMPNPGYPEVRAALAQKLKRETGQPYTGDDIVMTVGAAGALNVILKALLDPGDEVIVLNPFFPEYEFYIGNHRGTMVRVETGEDFLPDVERIAAAITPRTRAILLNTPNNPTGRIYPESVLRELDAMLKRQDHEIIVLSDEPYKAFVFDGQKQTEVSSCISTTAICNSWSKSLGLPGERIGYLALSPHLRDLDELRKACTFANRTLGFVNAPAIWQWVLMDSMNATIDPAPYEHKRNVLCDSLKKIGYDVRPPQGSFYVFQKTPIADDIAFCAALAKEGVLGVPGTGFGRSGYMRLSLTIPLERIEKSAGGFERAFHAVV